MKTLLASLILVAAPAFARGVKAHEHGIATVSIAIDKNMLLIGAEMTAEAAFGFEHIPKTDAEKKKVADVRKTLKEQGLDLFVFPTDLGCKLTNVLLSDSLAASGHADVDVDYTFSCEKSAAGSTLKLGLLKVFPRIKKVKVQVLSDAKQTGSEVTSADDVIKL